MSVRFHRHPSFRELNRLADRELEESRQRQVHDHLGECQRCRDQVALLRDLGAAAREISHPSPPEDALARILERRAAGDRVILPVSASLRAVRRRRAIGLAAGIGGALLAATLLLLPANEASAGASDLRFDPAQPEPGDRIEVTYTPTSALAAEEVLRLRGAWRSAGDPVPRDGLPGAVRFELRRTEKGTFVGSLDMPSDAVFGYFAVENETASEIDVGSGRFWSILAHRDGIPARDALWEQLQVVRVDDVDAGLSATAMLLDYYPDDIDGQARRLSFQRKTAVGAEREEILSGHRETLVRLSASLRERELDTLDALDASALGHAEGLWRYAWQLGERELTGYWGDVLERLNSRLAVQVRLAREPDDKDVLHQLAAYEREWIRAGLSDDYIAGQAFRAAVDGNDPESVLRWGRRHNRIRPDEAGSVAEELARFESLRELAKEGLRNELRRLAERSPDRRELDETRDEFLARDRQRSARLHALLGQLLVEDGRYAAAIDTLWLAVEEVWSLQGFKSLADSYLALGDTTEARGLYAYAAAAEPTADARQALRAALQRRFGPQFTDDEWSHLVEEAIGHLAVRTVKEAGTPRRPSGDPHVQTGSGESVPLNSLVAGRVSIVVFSTGPQLSRPETGLLSEQAELQALNDRGVEVITITETPQSADLDDLLEEEDLELRLFYDVKFEAARSLRTLGLPYHYVVDRNGRFYYAEDMSHAIRLAESLRRTSLTT